ncbi:MAG: adenine phosphoribosyltransferase [Mycoplasmataceae bacterium]|nr:adenine phosphoribosyltransferase [Mycoplasmataceae bacterium]
MIREDVKKYLRDVQDFPKPGIVFKDISPILENPDVMKFITKEFAKEVEGADVIVGPDARGFLFGVPLSMESNKPFVMVRKPGKLPGEVISFEYDLEYGTNTLEILKDSLKKGDKVVVVDDLLATGGTVEAIVKLVNSLGATVIKTLFVVELEFLKGRDKIDSEVVSIVKY